MTVALPVAEWQQLGVRLPSGDALPGDVPDAALVSGTTRHFLVYHNYDALLDYNCAHSYADQRRAPGGQIPVDRPPSLRQARRAGQAQDRRSQAKV